MMKIFNQTFKKKDNNADTLILYATKSGNAKSVAHLAHKYYKKNGWKTRCANISKYSPIQLHNISHLLLVVSTDGEGEPPPSAKKFFKSLYSSQMPQLGHLKYTVCALGDSTYQLFCEAGKNIDQRLQQLRAEQIYPRVDCDIDFAEPAISWIKDSYHHLSGNGTGTHDTTLEELNVAEKPHFTGKVITKEQLSSDESGSSCFHLKIAHDDGFTGYEPGDSIEIKPENPDWMVHELLNIMETNAHLVVEEKDTIKDKLKKEKEITRLTEKTLRQYHEKYPNPALSSLLKNKSELFSYFSCANVIDMLQDFRTATISPTDLLDMLPSVSYRQYSIASGATTERHSLELLVKTQCYNSNGRKHVGAASNYLCNELSLNASFTFRLYQNSYFRFPENPENPVIMIAVGTGIAPFRAFLQQRAALGIKSKTWLIFGEKNSCENFYYEEELHEFRKNKVLEKFDVVFSRDYSEKRYVQDFLMDKQHDVLAWLENNAHIYVCGSIAMGKGVRICLNEVLQGTDSSASSVEDLIIHHRYHEDVY
jgi:sulfite reductase alpha subunit-like flavoprotein